MLGILNLNKPPGLTSRRVVDLVQRIVRPAKVGHAGTLDPLATGVLVVCVGAATRLIEYVQRMPKQYRGTFLLGRESNTEDIEGEVVPLVDPPVPTRADIEAALPDFTGTIQQRPPDFSALKLGGRRAYDLARAGQAIELAPRPVTIYSLSLVDYQYPAVTLDVTCSGGTYIRSLGRDLAQSLGTGAVMASLVRTAVGPFALSEATEPKTLTAANLAASVQSPLAALTDLPCIQLDDNERGKIAHGIAILPDAARLVTDYLGEYKALDPTGRLVAILAPRRSGEFGPARNFPST